MNSILAKKLFFIVGESGSGKTSVADILESKGFDVLQSYTTRPQRYDGEKGHIFCTDDQYFEFFKDSEIAAYTYFDNNHYFSTKSQIKNSDIYIIDPDGIEYLKDVVKDIEYVTIYLKVDKSERIHRMHKRGDSSEKIEARIINDENKFKNLECDYFISNHDLNRTAMIIEYIMNTENKIVLH